MNSLILRETTRVLVTLILVFSVFMLLRGHDHPGGGFVGGLIASIAFSLYMFATDAKTVRRALRVDTRRIGAFGLGLAAASGFAGLAVDGSAFLTSQWLTVAGIKVGTPLVFDIGVYFVVVGAVLTIILTLKEQSSER